MSDLIDRQEAIQIHCELCAYNGDCICEYCRDAEAFMMLPTAEPRKGRWIVHDWTGLIVCDQCGFDAPMSTITGQQYESEYCQTCGARMEESE